MKVTAPLFALALSLLINTAFSQGSEDCSQAPVLSEGTHEGPAVRYDPDNDAVIPVYYTYTAQAQETIHILFDAPTFTFGSFIAGGTLEVFNGDCSSADLLATETTNERNPAALALHLSEGQQIIYKISSAPEGYTLTMKKISCSSAPYITNFHSRATPTTLFYAWSFNPDVFVWEYAVVPSGSVIESTDIKTTYSISINESGLEPESGYEIHIRPVGCEDWETQEIFTEGCIQPSAVSVSNQTGYTLTVQWTGDGSKVDYWEIGIAPSPEVPGDFAEVSGREYKFSNLDPETVYAVVVRGNTCTEGTPIFAETVHPCDLHPSQYFVKPTFTPDDKQDGYRIEWDHLEAESWDLEWISEGGQFDENPDITGIVTHPNIYEMNIGETYKVKVRPVCADQTGLWSREVNVRTGQVVPNNTCETALNLAEYSGAGDLNYSISGYNLSTNTVLPECRQDDNGGDRFYKIIPAEDGFLNVSAYAEFIYSGIYIYQGTCSSGEPIVCEEAFPGEMNNDGAVTATVSDFLLTSGETYYIMIKSFSGFLSEIHIDGDFAVVLNAENAFETAVDVFPTITDNIVNIKLAEETSVDYKVVNLQGLVMSEGKVNKSAAISFDNFTSGLYLLYLSDGNSVSSYKIVKKP